MFQEGKKYRVKTLKQLLATPGAKLRDDGYVVEFSNSPVVYALCNAMKDYLGTDIVLTSVTNAGSKARHGSYTFIPEMILWETKKLKLLNAIKDFV